MNFDELTTPEETLVLLSKSFEDAKYYSHLIGSWLKQSVKPVKRKRFQLKIATEMDKQNQLFAHYQKLVNMSKSTGIVCAKCGKDIKIGDIVNTEEKACHECIEGDQSDYYDYPPDIKQKGK
jgi:hypothetical protein